jgi:hypothetical protein
MSYRITINEPNGTPASQPFNSSTDINQLVESIYQIIKPSGNPRPTINILLGSTNLKEFQNLVESKGVSAEYYEFPLGGSTLFKNFGEKINSSSVRSPDKNYGVVLGKSGYSETEVKPFKVTQIANNIPILRFIHSQVILRDQEGISFILDTSNSGLDSNEIADAISSKDNRLSKSFYRDLQEYQSCLEDIRRNPQVQSDCDRVNFVVYISR